MPGSIFNSATVYAIPNLKSKPPNSRSRHRASTLKLRNACKIVSGLRCKVPKHSPQVYIGSRAVNVGAEYMKSWMRLTVESFYTSSLTSSVIRLDALHSLMALPRNFKPQQQILNPELKVSFLPAAWWHRQGTSGCGPILGRDSAGGEVVLQTGI